MSIAAWSTAVVAALLFVSTSVFHAPVLAGPIHDAAKASNAEEVERLITAGADVDEKDVSYKTALQWAANEGHMGVVQVLVAKGANVNGKDVTDVTPLHLAVLGQHESILEFLIAKGADVSSADSEGTTALDDATRLGFAGIIGILKRAGTKCGTNTYYSSWCKSAEGSE